MCGFAGIIDLNRLNIDGNLDRRMKSALKSLYSRGPDQNGIRTDEYSYLVHARLSIIDTTDNGKQPMHKYGKTLVYNGEIYNYQQVKIKLQKYGYKFYSNSDTEVLLAAWDKWEEKALEYINGMYAFAVWDKSDEKLTLVRDPFGKKPLLYSRNNNKIAFASDLKSLEKIIDCDEINPIAVESLFKLRFIHDPLTIYANVHKLQPGHIINIKKEKLELRKWYNLKKDLRSENNKTIVHKNINNYFDAAVKRRLVSDVNLGVFLSGGLDSSLIVSSLAEQGYNLPCFTMGYAGVSDYYEERPQAQRLAKHYGMEHHSFEVTEKDILKKIPEIFNASDEPFADTSAIPFYMLSNEVKSKVKVVLSGDGGDEVFGGYRKHLGEKWSTASYLIPQFMRKIIIRLLIENKNTHYGEISRRIRRYLMNVSKDGSQRQAGWLEQINEESIKKLLGSNIEHTKNLLDIYRQPFKDKINAMLAGDLGFSLSGDMLVKADRMSMANSLEVRSPFLDKELVEYVFSLPGHLKIGTFRGKKLLKDSFHNRLPKWSMSLPKKGFEVPINDWLRSNLKSMVEDSCSKKSLEKLGIVNKGIVDDWKQGLYSGKRDTSWQLWTLISYKQWLESKGKF
jgi:asparagine synthase (glutamine-hydrolysing)